jgi:hypothetical protein
MRNFTTASQIDVRDWHRRGLLQGWGFTWSWHTRDGERVAWIQVRVQPGQQVTLIYRVREGGREWQDVEQPVVLTWTPCHYGGQHPWFICPGVVNGCVCGRRVAILYGAGRYFLCRHCYDLTYESQQEDRPTRLITKAQNIRRRLGGSANSMEPFPAKSKGMHWRTYSRLYLKARSAERGSLHAMLAHLERRTSPRAQ